MARPYPHSPRAAAEPGPGPGPRVPDRSLTPEEPLPAVAIRAAGIHAFVYRKMVEGPVGAAVPQFGCPGCGLTPYSAAPGRTMSK